MGDINGYELWRDCIRWLVDVEVLRNDHKVAQATATIQEFAALLRDGVLLCHLVNHLVPNTIEEKQIPSQVHHLSEFQCEKIICLFLDAAQRVFKIRDSELFVAWELYCMTDFMKVLKTLSFISHSDICKRLGKSSFPYRSQTTETFIPPPEDEEIYKNLQENVEIENTYDYTYRPLAEEDDKIYDHFVARHDSIREWKNDTWSSFHPTSKREHSIKELLDTEKNYVEKALNMIMTKFHAPLQQYFPDTKDHETVFMNISDLWSLHQSFYNDLQQAVLCTLGIQASCETRPSFLGKYIGDVFLLHKEKFIAYGPYCMALEESRRKLMDIEKSDSLLRGKIFACTQEVNDNQFKLQDLLCLPMQRVLKYPLLLGEMLKATPIDAVDRKSIEQAKEAMEDLSAFVNEMKRDHEARQLIIEIERSISDLYMPDNASLLDYGRLNTDCEVKVIESTERVAGRPKNRHVFLFDKVLFICQAKRGNSYVYKGAYFLHQLNIDNGHTENKFGTLRISSSSKNQVHLLREISERDRVCGTYNAEPVKYITLSFKLKPQMENWIAQFEQSKDNVFPHAAKLARHRVKFCTFDAHSAYFCSVCSKFLKGLMFQGYECEYCRGIFHKNCLGLRQCPGKRPPSITPNASFTFRDNSHRGRKAESLCSGEQVIGNQNVSDLQSQQFLAFEKDDIIEVVQSHDDKTFFGKHVMSKKCGLVKIEDVRRRRFNSLVGLSTLNFSNDESASTRIDRKESTVLPRRPNTLRTPTQQLSDYINTDIASQIWFVGDMPRQEAQDKLKNTPDGTFLVRFSTNQLRYAISISYKGDVKHTKIEEGENGEFFFDEVCKFGSIVELVNYYRKTSLSECFELLNTELREPYMECKLYRALHDFPSTEPKFLELRKGDIVALLDTVGEDRGWWKGKIGSGFDEKVGFFPLTYVEPYVP